jgi:hypothetical protein
MLLFVLHCSKGSDVTLLHTCAKQSNVPLQIPLRLLSLGANPNAQSPVKISMFSSGCMSFQPALKRMDVLASAVKHRATQTQLALLTCPEVQLVSEDAQVAWYLCGCYEDQELACAWPTQHENQAAGKKQSLWWTDMLDAAFRYIFLAREYYVQLASGEVVMGLNPSIKHVTTREWSFSALHCFGCDSLLDFIEEYLGTLPPEVLQLVYALMVDSFDSAVDYAHGRRGGEELDAAEMAKEIMGCVGVSSATMNACCCIAENFPRLTADRHASLT